MQSPNDDPTTEVVIIVGKDASTLEHLAANELKGMLERLFRVRVATQPNEQAKARILIGRPATNESLRKAIGKNWPKLTDQGVFLRKLKTAPPTLVVGGGSPVAVLWSAYELGERLGVRYLLDRDVYPAKRAWKGLPKIDTVMEPNMRIRCWRLINDLPNGPVSWSLQENRRFLRQMAKLKFNRIHTFLWPAQPFVHYTFRGMPKPPGFLYFGLKHPIDKDTIGRKHFKGMTEFTNPEFVGAKTPQQLHRRAVALVRGIHSEARRLGMQVQVSFEAFNWPKEFIKVMPKAQPAHQLGDVSIQPGNDQSVDDPLLREMVTTVARAYIETYPKIDFIQVTVPEHRRWLSQGREAYRRLHSRYDLSKMGTYDELCARARSRTSFPGGGKRVERQVKSDLASLWLFDSLIRTKKLLKRPGGGDDVKLIYDGVTQELFPLVARITPPGGEVVSFIDYTASRVLRRRDLIQQTPSKDVPVSLILTLADDNVGVLPQLATGTFHQLLPVLRKSGWAGFYTRYWTVGEQDPAIQYLARASWDTAITSQQAYLDQVKHVCGLDAAQPALKAFALIEQITLGMDKHALGFGFPVPGMMTKHYNRGGLTAEMKKEHERYRQALAFMEQAHRRSRPEGRGWTKYFVSRLRFAVRYLDAAEAFGATALALKAKRRQEARRQADAAYNAIREALETYVGVAKDHGDLGAVALMNEYCYRPIRNKRNELR